MALYASATAMIRDTSGMLLVSKAVGIPLAVDALMMVADDRRDLRVLVDVRQDSLADRGVLLHLAPLLERERTGLLEQARWQADLADVVNEAAEVRLVSNSQLRSPMRSAMSRE